MHDTYQVYVYLLSRVPGTKGAYEYAIIRAKLVSNCYIPKKKSALVRVHD